MRNDKSPIRVLPTYGGCVQRTELHRGGYKGCRHDALSETDPVKAEEEGALEQVGGGRGAAGDGLSTSVTAGGGGDGKGWIFQS